MGRVGPCVEADGRDARPLDSDPGAQATERALLIGRLRRRRSTLWKAYIVHVGWFTSTVAFAATDTTQAAITTSLWLTLVTVLPVLVYTAAVHKACRAIDPAARTVGWVPIVLATVLLSPFESGLILPARNLWVSAGILRAWGDGPDIGSMRP